MLVVLGFVKSADTMLKFNVNGADVILDSNEHSHHNNDLIAVSSNQRHVLNKNKSYNVQIVKADENRGEYEILINGNRYTYQLVNKADQYLERLGITAANNTNSARVSAPMPGLVLEVMVKKGDEVHKGDPLLILEAMKMENVIKAEAEGTVQEVNVDPGASVEKSQVLIQF